MKPSKKIFLLLATTALLASCSGGGSSSSSGGAFSSGAGSSDASQQSSIPFNPTTQEKARDALLSAYEVSAKQNKISLGGRIAANGEFSGRLATHTEGGTMVADVVRGKVDGVYQLNAAVAGLREGEFKYNISLAGHHELEYGVGEQIMKNSYEGEGGFYAANGNAYFNVDEALSTMLEAMIGYPYGGGKQYIEDAFNGMPSPLLDDETIAQGKQYIAQGVDTALEQAGEFLKFLNYGDLFRVEAALDRETVAKIGEKFAKGSEEAMMVFAILGKVDYKQAVVTLDYDTKLGFQSLYLGLDLSLEGTVKEIFPVESGYPEMIANEKVSAFINAEIALGFEYGRDVTLPADLGDYTKIEAGGGSHGGPSGDVDDLIAFISNLKDPSYTAVVRTDLSTGEVTTSDINQGTWSEYTETIYHLNPTVLRGYKPENVEWHMDEDNLWVEIYQVFDTADGKVILNAFIQYPAEHNYLYASQAKISMKDSGGTSASIAYGFEWGYIVD